MPRIDPALVRTFRDRLVAAPARSPFLRVAPSDRGRMLDCSRLDAVRQGLASALVNAFVTADKPLTLNLDPQPAAAQRLSRPPATAERPVLFHVLENRIRRHGELMKRETGCHAVWLGYPLIQVPHADGALLAPLVLWPARVEIDRRYQGRLRVGPEDQSSAVLGNRALAVWVAHHLGVRLQELDGGWLQEGGWSALREYAAGVCGQLGVPEPPVLEGEPGPVSLLAERPGIAGPELLDAAVLGIFSGSPEAVIRDLECIADAEVCPDLASAFLTGTRPPDAPAAEPPPETDRHLVLPADFSQERVVWQARQAPGLVVQGPPGTGKSQTIVNVIADALGREKTVLMVCQKETATRVVFERLRSVGLHDLCVTTHDPEGDRLRVFRAVNARIEELKKSAAKASTAQAGRQELAARIQTCEDRLDRHARALHEPDADVGLSYRQVVARLFHVYHHETDGAVRPVQGFPSWRGCTGQELDQIARAAAEAGRQFRAADAGRNPWKHRTGRAHVTTPEVLRRETAEICRALQERFGPYEQFVESAGGPGVALPSDLGRFAGLARTALKRLGPLAENPLAAGWWTRVVLRWQSWRHGRRHPWLHDLVRALEAALGSPSLAGLLAEVERATRRTEAAREVLAELRRLSPYLGNEALEEAEAEVLAGRSPGRWVNRVTEGLKVLADLAGYEQMRKRHAGRLDELVRALEGYESALASGEPLPRPPQGWGDGPAEKGRWWSALVRFHVCEEWRRQLEGRHPELLAAPPHQQEHAGELREALEEKWRSEPAAIRERWTRRVRTWLGEDWGSRFRVGGNQHVRATRFREAVELSVGRGLLDLYPCWLVSPEVASQLFPLRPGLFDVVIFDEASQCPLEQAIPAIYRGKTLVVMGDEHQMPPTSFFSTRAEAEPADDAEADGRPAGLDVSADGRHRTELLRQAESLLDAAGPTFRSERLLVHYRSEDPALIEFSNRTFYEGKLEAAVPPSPKRPIEYVWVGGTYEGRTNQAEAEKVVELVRGLWCGEAKEIPSVGVVTFNQPQQELIENLIQDACYTDEEFRERYAEQSQRRTADNQDAGFFVRNLENVQGDERDVILFSTTFGRDRSGRFYRRFGPAGARGGHRRLNVAVTRARKKNVILSSMPIEEIAPPDRRDTPAGYLQRYLEHARAVSEAAGRPPRTGEPASAGEERLESPLEQEVYQALAERGYRVDCQVGEAGFRIDLAVRHEGPSRGYALGIECDGAAYHSGRPARIRDVWRQGLLEGLGWKIYRVWSMRWWADRGAEIERLVRAVEAARR